MASPGDRSEEWCGDAWLQQQNRSGDALGPALGDAAGPLLGDELGTLVRGDVEDGLVGGGVREQVGWSVAIPIMCLPDYLAGLSCCWTLHGTDCGGDSRRFKWES